MFRSHRIFFSPATRYLASRPLYHTRPRPVALGLGLAYLQNGRAPLSRTQRASLGTQSNGGSNGGSGHRYQHTGSGAVGSNLPEASQDNATIQAFYHKDDKERDIRDEFPLRISRAELESLSNRLTESLREDPGEKRRFVELSRELADALEDFTTAKDERGMPSVKQYTRLVNISKIVLAVEENFDESLLEHRGDSISIAKLVEDIDVVLAMAGANAIAKQLNEMNLSWWKIKFVSPARFGSNQSEQILLNMVKAIGNAVDHQDKKKRRWFSKRERFLLLAMADSHKKVLRARHNQR